MNIQLVLFHLRYNNTFFFGNFNSLILLMLVLEMSLVKVASDIQKYHVLLPWNLFLNPLLFQVTVWQLNDIICIQ